MDGMGAGRSSLCLALLRSAVVGGWMENKSKTTRLVGFTFLFYFIHHIYLNF
jgi:hypothetical protein